MSSYKDLIVWQKSIQLCIDIYKETETFPKHELYGLTSQLRRSVVAISSNIAEGQRRGHKNEYIQFLRIAYGSSAELETQLIISNKVGYLNDIKYEKLNRLLLEILKMLNKLIKVLLQPTTYNL